MLLMSAQRDGWRQDVPEVEAAGVVAVRRARRAEVGEVDAEAHDRSLACGEAVDVAVEPERAGRRSADRLDPLDQPDRHGGHDGEVDAGRAATCRGPPSPRPAASSRCRGCRETRSRAASVTRRRRPTRTPRRGSTKRAGPTVEPRVQVRPSGDSRSSAGASWVARRGRRGAGDVVGAHGQEVGDHRVARADAAVEVDADLEADEVALAEPGLRGGEVVGLAVAGSRRCRTARRASAGRWSCRW